GLGGALFEEIDFPGGRIRNASLASYRVPRLLDLPAVEVTLLDRPDQRSPRPSPTRSPTLAGSGCGPCRWRATARSLVSRSSSGLTAVVAHVGQCRYRHGQVRPAICGGPAAARPAAARIAAAVRLAGLVTVATALRLLPGPLPRLSPRPALAPRIRARPSRGRLPG